MKVEMVTNLAGPTGAASAGEIVQVSAEFGAELIKAGNKEYAGDKPARKLEGPETATAKKAEHAAGGPQQNKK